ncbi:hypothetical protein DNTS_021616 [Danionella cerebrum]|uniref:Uncharacterized protein n=1 Tax=Danionella cerebrum TaxID=2873325 RepID=A0A553QY86_9TELE|nr:hypothetical protein DNTS_021616 [Danionella translucida]
MNTAAEETVPLVRHFGPILSTVLLKALAELKGGRAESASKALCKQRTTCSRQQRSDRKRREFSVAQNILPLTSRSPQRERERERERERDSQLRDPDMHFQKPSKEKACYSLPTVKKLLEQKRKRETSSAPPCYSTALCPSDGATSVSALSSAQSPTPGSSTSYTDMAAVRYERWEVPSVLQPHSSQQQCSPFPLASSSSLDFTGSTLSSGYGSQQMQRCQEPQAAPQYSLAECPATAAVTGLSAPTPMHPPGSSMRWSPEFRVDEHVPRCPLQVSRPQMDMMRLQQAQHFLKNMDNSRTLWQDHDGDTMLHIYTAQGERECAFAAAEKLCELGKLDSKEHKGKTALLVAVTANQPDIVHDLLFLGADISTCDVNGQTALHLAATYGFPQVMQVLLFSGRQVDLEARNFEGLTSLHCAVISHSSTMKTMNSSSASTWLNGGILQTQAEEKLLCLQLLINAGASLLTQILLTELFLMFLKDDGFQLVMKRWTVLDAIFNLCSMTEGNLIEIKSNKTVLHLAVKEGNIQLTRFLLSLQISSMQEFINLKAHGHTALHMAAGLHGNPYQEDLIRLLLSHGADSSIRNLENDQPAHLLQSGEMGERLKLILKKKSASSRRRLISLQDQE